DGLYHGFQPFEAAEDLRKNVRMVKLNYILPDYFKTANNEFEIFWIPGDWQGNGFLVNVADARNPWAVPAATARQGFNQNGQPFRNQSFLDIGAKPMIFSGGLFFDQDVVSTSPEPANSITESSEFGGRLSSLLPIGNGLQTSFIYLYEARNQPTGFCSSCTSAGGVNGLGQEGIGPAGFTRAAPGIFAGARIFTYGPPHPGVPKAGTLRVLLVNNHRRNNYFGLTGTYYDKDLTDVVYRYDILWEPRTGINVAGNNVQAQPAKGSSAEWTERARFILAADRPTYIPWLSKQHTFLTAQYVNTWYPDRPSNAVPSIANFIGKVREVNNFFFVSAVNSFLNRHLLTPTPFASHIP